VTSLSRAAATTSVVTVRSSLISPHACSGRKAGRVISCKRRIWPSYSLRQYSAESTTKFDQDYSRRVSCYHRPVARIPNVQSAVPAPKAAMALVRNRLVSSPARRFRFAQAVVVSPATNPRRRPSPGTRHIDPKTSVSNRLDRARERSACRFGAIQDVLAAHERRDRWLTTQFCAGPAT
jgi:hypothetical protein